MEFSKFAGKYAVPL